MFHEDANVLKHHLQQSAELSITWFRENHMQANPSKFQAIVIMHGQKKFPGDLEISGLTVPLRSCVKLLGMHIDDDLKFHSHVTYVCKKSSSQLNAISRISKYLDVKCRTALYNSFIMSNFNFGNTIWHFCNISDI